MLKFLYFMIFCKLLQNFSLKHLYWDISTKIILLLVINRNLLITFELYNHIMTNYLLLNNFICHFVKFCSMTRQFSLLVLFGETSYQLVPSSSTWRYILSATIRLNEAFFGFNHFQYALRIESLSTERWLNSLGNLV